MPLGIFTASISIHPDSTSFRLQQRWLEFPGLLLYFCFCKTGMEPSALQMLNKRATTEQVLFLCSLQQPRELTLERYWNARPLCKNDTQIPEMLPTSFLFQEGFSV